MTAAGTRLVTTSDGVTDRLADEITTGVLPSGTRLDEQSLASRFGVSRTPVREALRQLEATGLVERRPYRGVVVGMPTPERLSEMFVAMGEIEAVCARQAALMMDSAERRAIRSWHDAMAALVREGEPAAYAKANLAFHDHIYTGAHNTILSGVAENLRRRLMPYRRAQFRNPGRLAKSHAEHEAVLRAIERGELEEAATRMRDHMMLVETAFDAIGTFG